MALRDQPYIPLYVNIYLSDERLRECQPASVGIYSFIMCVMHKSNEYGTILLKQNDKQDNNQIKNFALKLTKHLPYNSAIIEVALTDLIEQNVLKMDGDKLLQKRMIHDNKISLIRAESGKKGGTKTGEKFAKAKAKAKTEANSVNVNVNNNSLNDSISKEKERKKEKEGVPEYLIDIWPEFLEMRKKIRKPATDYAQKLLIMDLNRLYPDNPEMQIKSVEQSIKKSYQGVFEVRDVVEEHIFSEQQINKWINEKLIELKDTSYDKDSKAYKIINSAKYKILKDRNFA